MTSLESTQLLSCLSGQRRHVLGILDGLDETALRRPVLPSGWTCAELLHHLALDDERFWFRAVVGGDPEAIGYFADSPDGWQVGTDVPAHEIVALYRRETELADTVLAATSLDAPVAWLPDGLGWQPDDVRDVILHVIAETACHAGHLDAVRELIDGRRWLVLDE